MTTDNFYKKLALSIIKGERFFRYWGVEYQIDPSERKNGKGEDIYDLYVIAANGNKSLERSFACSEAKLRKWSE